jgi:hypothetical protein
VVLACDLNMDFLIALPIAVLSWKRLGVRAVVILIGERSDFVSNAKIRLIYQMLQKMKVNLFLLSFIQVLGKHLFFKFEQNSQLHFVAG